MRPLRGAASYPVQLFPAIEILELRLGLAVPAAPVAPRPRGFNTLNQLAGGDDDGGSGGGGGGDGGGDGGGGRGGRTDHGGGGIGEASVVSALHGGDASASAAPAAGGAARGAAGGVLQPFALGADPALGLPHRGAGADAAAGILAGPDAAGGGIYTHRLGVSPTTVLWANKAKATMQEEAADSSGLASQRGGGDGGGESGDTEALVMAEAAGAKEGASPVLVSAAVAAAAGPRPTTGAQQAFRVGVVAATGLAAAVVPNLGALIALVGAVSGSLIAIVLPAAIDMACPRKAPGFAGGDGGGGDGSRVRPEGIGLGVWFGFGRGGWSVGGVCLGVLGAFVSAASLNSC